MVVPSRLGCPPRRACFRQHRLDGQLVGVPAVRAASNRASGNVADWSSHLLPPAVSDDGLTAVEVVLAALDSLLVSYVPLASLHKREALAVDAAACPLRQANSLVTHTARLLSTTERANRIGASLQLINKPAPRRRCGHARAGFCDALAARSLRRHPSQINFGKR